MAGRAWEGKREFRLKMGSDPPGCIGQHVGTGRRRGREAASGERSRGPEVEGAKVEASRGGPECEATRGGPEV